MATPLYKFMRNKGTSFFIFPSAIKDFSLECFQNSIKITPTKFILLDIPKSVTGTTTDSGVLDFIKSYSGYDGTKLYSFDPDGPRSNYVYSESLIEGLRNYVANADTVYRESKITIKKDFYNPSENMTPIEMIFWKWCRKMNILDLEPAVNGIDWDKNLSNFDNSNGSSFTNRDYFRKYLWKEREIIPYSCVLEPSASVPKITINEIAKFKVGDKIFIYSGYTGIQINTGISYVIDSVTFGASDTEIILDVVGYSDPIESCYCKLDYHRLVQYIGEVQAVSKVQTSQNNFTEFTAMVPAQAGKTPTILWEISSNSNYYPGLEIPMLVEEIQPEINGAEYLISPIRTNPGDYPGSYFGYFDTVDKTYLNSSGDLLRYKGMYYGILREFNDGIADDDYVERLTEFNSDNIDGLVLDFDKREYLKMNLPDSTVSNFDEFNAMIINEEPPQDFEFNAILWYYDIDDGSGNITTNLYGIEFLNNPDDDFGLDDDKLISPTRKLVTNTNQDGLSYLYNLNLDFKVDNDMMPLVYDPTSVYNLFGFDLYNNVLANYGKLNQNFMTIINEFITLNKKILDLESIIYSQTSLEEIKKRLNNQDELLKLYKTNQFVNSDTIGIEVDYTKNYPAIKFNTKVVDYNEIYNLYSTDIITYNIVHENVEPLTTYPPIDPYVGDVRRGSSWSVVIPNQGKTLVNVYNDVITEYSGRTVGVILDKDLAFKQGIDFLIMSDISLFTNKFQINVMFDDGTGIGRKEKELVGNMPLPIDVLDYNSFNPTGSTFNSSYYYDLETYVDSVITGVTGGVTEMDIEEALFDSGDWVYVDGFYMKNGDVVSDYSGLYKILTGGTIQVYLDLDSSEYGMLQGKPRIFYYKGMKISILRIDSSNTSNIEHRYLVNREFLTSDYLQKLNL